MMLRVLFTNVFIICALLLSCKSKDAENTSNSFSKSIKTEDYYLNEFINFDTISTAQKNEKINSFIQDFENFDQKNQSNIYNLFKAIQLRYNNKEDSILFYLNNINNEANEDIKALKSKELILLNVKNNSIIPYEIIEYALQSAHTADQNKSRFTYWLYDELARIFYQNKDYEKSQEYAALYFENSPHKNSLKVQQRYFDIRFLLAQSLYDIQNMEFFLEKAKSLAFQINDSVAIARSYDYEALYYYHINELEKGIEQNKKSIALFEKMKVYSFFQYANLASIYNQAMQPDSAIYYLNKGYKYLDTTIENLDRSTYFKKIGVSYYLKKDYKKAAEAKDSLYLYTLLNINKMQIGKIAELEIKFNTEKKDLEIKNLHETNFLNEKIIAQQKWLLLAGALLTFLFLFSLHTIWKRKLLKEQNEKLEIENKKHIVEQKVRQMQLNPHFIYNAIANMQGLINEDNKADANNYLISLSKHIRNMLELNRQEYITIEEEVNSLENYLKLQQMRYGNNFDYKINVNINKDDFVILPMIIQPFVENSIEHGFKNINYKGFLEITINEEGNLLKIIIVDNGSGKGSQNPFGKKSLSRIITQERIDLIFNRNGNKNAYFEANPISENNKTGYKVEIVMPILKA